MQRSELLGTLAPGTLRSLALPLFTRPGTGVLALGQRGCTRRGELSVFATSLELLSLPSDPYSLMRIAPLVACGALALEEVAAALAAGARARKCKSNDTDVDESAREAAQSGLQACASMCISSIIMRLLIFEHLKTLEAMLCPLAVCRSSCTCTTPPNLAALPSRLRRANWLPLSMAAAHLLALECSASAQLNNRQMEPTLEPKPALTTSLDSQPPKYCP